ncbi:GH92 family glycosyl hydrolase [uncultured Parabacteroides sp.]
MQTVNAQKPVDFVNPFIDCHNSRWFYFNSASRPFGMVNLSPDTDTKSTWGSGYLYDSKYIRCFSHIHAWQMSGVAVMPTVGEFKGHKGMDAYQSAYTHEGEIAKPGYHKVYLSDYDVWAELTSSTRAGFHKYTFPESDQSYILIDVGAYLAHGPKAHAEVWKVSDTEIAGYEIMEQTIRRPKDTPVYFYMEFSKPFDDVLMWKDSSLIRKNPNSTNTHFVERVSGRNAGLAVRYQTSKGETVQLKVGISYVSVEQAKKNLRGEVSHWDFDKVKQESYDEWNTMLSRIEVEGGTYERKVKFYTDLWHALLGRRTVSDIDGKYLDMTGDYPRIQQVRLGSDGKPLFPHMNFDAWWGSHWSLNILWSMAYPEVMDAFCNTMVDMYRNGGLIPRGPSGGNYTFVMIGDPSTPFFATAYNKGIRNYDVNLMYEGLRKNAFEGGSRDHSGYEHKKDAFEGGMSYYVNMGYIPQDRPLIGGDGAATVSMTLEYAYQDWCLAQIAQAMGKEDDYLFFMKRSQNYRNVWNPQTNYMHPKNKDGSWIDDFSPFNSKGFCESNSAINSYFVPHDIGGLIGLMGGKKKFSDRLNNAFVRSEPGGFLPHSKNRENNYTDYGNQPGTGMAHMFNYAGTPWLTQYWVRRVKNAYADINPYGGYNGDEDQGQMGALGVLMAIGLFEVDGGAAAKPIYEIATPFFDKVTIHLNKDYYPGESFMIKTINDPEKNTYIQKATLNGKTWNDCWFHHEDFTKGGVLELDLSDKPNKKWGINPPPTYKLKE